MRRLGVGQKPVYQFTTERFLAGVADGAECDILDIIALNIRTEIAFGQFSDGCTSLYWRDEHKAFLGQNWDVCHSLVHLH